MGPLPRAPGGSAFGECPVCGRRRPLSGLAAHVEACLAEPERKRRRPEPRAEPRPERRDRTDYDRRVDLHGLSRRAAAELLDRRLLEARLMGLENLLVITGRGLHSQGGPVLRLWLPEWAARQADGAPLRCEQADPEIGGAGAFLLGVRACLSTA